MKDNKLIAEFMDLPTETMGVKQEVVYGMNHDDWYTADNLNYHLFWNWLMPVVKKCYDNGADENEVGDITHALLDCDIDHTYRAVVEFINQLNR